MYEESGQTARCVGGALWQLMPYTDYHISDNVPMATIALFLCVVL